VQQLFVHIWKANQKEVSIELQFHEVPLFAYIPAHLAPRDTHKKSNKERTKKTCLPQLANTSAHYNQDLLYFPPVSCSLAV
jgi:hypothetical protein